MLLRCVLSAPPLGGTPKERGRKVCTAIRRACRNFGRVLGLAWLRFGRMPVPHQQHIWRGGTEVCWLGRARPAPDHVIRLCCGTPTCLEIRGQLRRMSGRPRVAPAARLACAWRRCHQSTEQATAVLRTTRLCRRCLFDTIGESLHEANLSLPHVQETS